MAQHVEVPATKSGDLSLTWDPHGGKEKNQATLTSCPLTLLCIRTHIHTLSHTHTHLYIHSHTQTLTHTFTHMYRLTHIK